MLELHIQVWSSSRENDIANIMQHKHKCRDLHEIKVATVEYQSTCHEVMQGVLIVFQFLLLSEEHQLD